MYQKYYTDALVLSHAESGEADRVFSLYTREFGALRARASAARAETSRMRCALQTASRARTALIRGKRGWRLAGAVSVRQPVAAQFPGVTAFVRLALLAERLIAGEEAHPDLFGLLDAAHEKLIRTSGREDAKDAELLAVARLLWSLGYLSDSVAPDLFADPCSFGPASLQTVSSRRSDVLAAVNAAIAASAL